MPTITPESGGPAAPGVTMTAHPMLTGGPGMLAPSPCLLEDYPGEKLVSPARLIIGPLTEVEVDAAQPRLGVVRGDIDALPGLRNGGPVGVVVEPAGDDRALEAPADEAHEDEIVDVGNRRKADALRGHGDPGQLQAGVPETDRAGVVVLVAVGGVGEDLG